MTPMTVSGIRSYDPRWLLDASQSWAKMGNTWEDTFDTAHRNVKDLPWTGAGREAAVQSAHDDWVWAQGHAQTAKALAKSANSGYHDLVGERDSVLRTIDATVKKGFTVAEDGTAVPNTTDPIEFITKEPDAIQATAAIKAGMASLAAHDAQVGGGLTEQAAAFGVPGKQAITGGAPPLWHTTQHDDPNWQHYDPNHPTPATEWEARHNGSNFNPGVILDTTHAESSGPPNPDWLTGLRTVNPDFPGLPVTGGPVPMDTSSSAPSIAPQDQGTGGGSPGFMNFYRSLATPPTGAPTPPPPTPRPGTPPNPQAPWIHPEPWQKPTGSPIPMPSFSPLSSTPSPPVMRAVPPGDGLLEAAQPAQGSWTEENPRPGPVVGSFVTGATIGCEAGAGWAAAISAPVMPAEAIAPEVGCVVGGVVGTVAPLAYPWIDNMLEGGG